MEGTSQPVLFNNMCSGVNDIQSEGDNNLVLYREAVSCLEQIANQVGNQEIQDISLIVHLYQSVLHVIQDIIVREPNDYYANSLRELLGILQWQKKLMVEKHGLTDQVVSSVSAMFPQPAEANLNDNFLHLVASSEDESTEIKDVNPDVKYATMRQNTILSTLTKPPVISLDDVAGLSEVKKLLKEALILPTLYPHLFTGARHPWSRFLLYGPPGTGKTRLAYALANEANAAFYCVSSADLLSSWVGESEKIIRDLFHYIRDQSGKCILFIDEIDGLCQKRNAKEEDFTRRVKTELLNQMEMSNSVPGNTLLLCATNCPWDLDTAFLRRFQRWIYVPLPDRDARLQILQLHSRGTEVLLTENNWKELADKTEDYSGSDLATLTQSAVFEPVRELENSLYWEENDLGQMSPCPSNQPGAIQCTVHDLPPDKVAVRKIELRDFMKALACIHRSVSPQDLAKYKTFTDKHGRIG